MTIDYPSTQMRVWQSLDRARLATLLDMDQALYVAELKSGRQTLTELTSSRTWQIKLEIKEELLRHNSKLIELKQDLIEAIEQESETTS